MPAEHFRNERTAMLEWENVKRLVVTQSFHLTD